MSLERALEVEVIAPRGAGGPLEATAASTLAARHGEEDRSLQVTDPGFYSAPVHALRKKMREQRTIEDFDWEISLITKSIEQLVDDVEELRAARDQAGLPERWVERLTRGYEGLQRELTKRLDIKTQMIERREKLRMSRRYLVESELIIRWGRKVDAVIERVVRSGLDAILRLAPGALQQANAWAADTLEDASLMLENIPEEIVREMAPGRAQAEARRATEPA